MTTTVGRQPPLRKVKTLSGQIIEVQGDGEAKFYVAQQRKYIDENKFTAVTDLQSLDQLLFQELLCFRYQSWLGSGRNYAGELLVPSEEVDCRRGLKEAGAIISQLKNELGLTKTQRDKEQYESVGAYLVNLKARAREHGVHREKQLQKMLVLGNELFAMIGAYDRANEVERIKLGLEKPEDILDWVRQVMRPEYDAIDEYFRSHAQRFWVRTI